MKIKRNIACIICFLLLFVTIGTGCSKKGEEAVDSNNQIANEQVLHEDTASEAVEENEEPSIEPSIEPSEEPTDEGNSPWKLISETNVDTSVYYAGFLNEAIGVTVGYSGATSYTEDGGKNWSVSGNVSACRYGLDFYDETFIVDSGNSGVNLISRDKGRTWSYLGSFLLKSGNAFNKFLSVLDTKNIYIGSSKALGVSVDGGTKWEELELPEGCRKPAGMFFLTPEIGYLFNADGTLYKTNDSCETWTSQTLDLSGESIITPSMPSAAINFQDEDHGMIVYATKSFKLCCSKTEDGGSTWETIEMPKVTGLAPYISRDGKYLTVSSQLKRISLFKLED